MFAAGRRSGGIERTATLNSYPLPNKRPTPRSRSGISGLGKIVPVSIVLTLIVGGAITYGLRTGISPAKAEEAQKQVLLAKALVDRGQPDKALVALTELEAKSLPLGEDGEWLRVQATRDAGDATGAGRLAEAFIAKYPKSIRFDDAQLVSLSSKVSTAGVSDPKLRAKVETFLASNSSTPSSLSLEAEIGLQEVGEGRIAEASARFDRLFASIPDDPRVRELAQAISDANVAALKNGTLDGGFLTHKVEKGEAVAVIAKKYGTTTELLLSINGIDDPRRLRIGQELKVPQTDWSLVCDVGANVLLLRNKGEFFKMYDVRTGRDPGATPKGEYKLLNKKQNPTWKPGDGRVYLPGDPNNELGTRWMSFEGDILGIHGTIREDTIGSYASNGCVGLAKDDVEELFDLVLVGTPLTIVGDQDSSRHKILPKPDVPAPQQMAMN